MMRSLWILGVLVAAAAVGFVWDAGRSNYRELIAGDATILGHLQGLVTRRAEYFSVRIRPDASNPALSTAYLQLSTGRRFVAARATPAELRRAGFQESPDHSNDRRFLSVGYGDQNRDGGVELAFRGPVLQELYARCHRPSACSFLIGWDGIEPFALPISERELEPRMPATTSTRDFRGK